MTPSTLASCPRHTAIIMDGNGRWAQAQGLPRVAGHRAGVAAVRSSVERAPSLGIAELTLYAFSADNWKRPPEEVNSLFFLFTRYLRQEIEGCIARGVRLHIIGRRDRLPANLVRAIEAAETATSGGKNLLLRIAIDYSARDSIARGEPPLPDVDLLIRTGGEQRLSDFLLRECAYAEISFTPTPWPDFDGDALAEAVVEFRQRHRRFGGLREKVS